MLVTISQIWKDRGIFNLGLSVFDPEDETWKDDIAISNGDRVRILVTTGMVALDWLKKNPKANLLATGSEGNGHLGIRTRMYQRGIEQNYEFLSERYNILGFVGERNDEGKLEGEWIDWSGEWVPFVIGTKYDKFLLNLKKAHIIKV